MVTTVLLIQVLWFYIYIIFLNATSKLFINNSGEIVDLPNTCVDWDGVVFGKHE